MLVEYSRVFLILVVLVLVVCLVLMMLIENGVFWMLVWFFLIEVW